MPEQPRLDEALPKEPGAFAERYDWIQYAKALQEALRVERERNERLERGILDALGVIGENKVWRMRQRLEAVLVEQEKEQEDEK